MTQQELAAAADVDLKTIYSLESGHRWPIAKNRAKIEAALKWPPESLTRLRDDGHLAPVSASAPFRIPLRRPDMDEASEAAYDQHLAAISARIRVAEAAEAKMARIECRPVRPVSGADVFPDQPKDARHWDDHRGDGIPADEVAMLIAFSHLAVQRAEQDPGRAVG